MIRKVVLFGSLILATAGLLVAGDVKIMTQNMDQGTGLGYIVAAASGQMTVGDAVDLTYAELNASHLQQRAGLIAGKIAEYAPDIVALQEVTVWWTGPTPALALIPVYDQLTYLLTALYTRGANYYVVAVNTVADFALPGNKIGALRITSRNVLLARRQWISPTLTFTNVQSHLFENALNIQGLEIKSGWISATVHSGDKQFFLAATHLQSTVTGLPEAATVQIAQGQELIDALRYVTGPVILCGDFNSDASNSPTAPDNTPTASNIVMAGYAEVWKLLKPYDPGRTWGLYEDDQIPISFPATTPSERIDLFFKRGIPAINIVKIVAPAPPGFTPPFGSDHAGVLATFWF